MINATTLEYFIERNHRYSDMDREQFAQIARVFCEAHARVPNQMSIEVGTRKGGSAGLFAELLREMYGENPPPLWTVDPYGHKPYVDGTPNELKLYGDELFVEMKSLMALFPFHTHWKMPSRSFFKALAYTPYWRQGVQCSGGEAAFILLDGEHAASSVGAELRAIWDGDWLAKGGTIVIDNINKDPRTVPMLKEWSNTWDRLDRAWAVGRP